MYEVYVVKVLKDGNSVVVTVFFVLFLSLLKTLITFKSFFNLWNREVWAETLKKLEFIFINSNSKRLLFCCCQFYNLTIFFPSLCKIWWMILSYLKNFHSGGCNFHKIVANKKDPPWSISIVLRCGVLGPCVLFLHISPCSCLPCKCRLKSISSSAAG